MDATPPPTPPTRDARLLSWPVLIALFCLPGIAWALAGPLFSAPDEPSHSVKAVALWNGQLSGEDTTSESGHLTTTFSLPGVWAQAAVVPACFAFAPDVTADCSPPFVGSESVSGVASTAGHYPPLFYALVGWGGRLSSGPVGLYLMRIAGAVACGALLAAAVRALVRVIDPRLALAGVLVACTPMVFFLAGSVNPNGLEISAAIAVWATLLAILHRGDGDGPVPRSSIVQLVVVGAVMALTRTLSPAFLGAIAVLAAVSVPVATIRRVLRDRTVLIGGGVLVVIAALAMLAVLTSGALASTPGRVGVAGRNPAVAILGETRGYLDEMIGVFGWLDTRAPAITFVAWFAAVFGLLALALAVATRRSAFGLLAVVTATVALPIVVQYPSAVAQGLPWQGRYTLPIAVGIPLLAVVVLGGDRRFARSVAPGVGIATATLTGVATVAAFVWALGRYTTGATGSLRITAGAWQPPGGPVLLVALVVVFATAAVALTILSGPGEDDTADDLGDGAPVPAGTAEPGRNERSGLAANRAG